MLIMDAKLPATPVLSVRAGGMVTRVLQPIVDPDTLKIIAFRCIGGVVPKMGLRFLMVKSIREYSRFGMVIDDIEELVEKGEIVRLDEVLKLNFGMIGLRVVTKKGQKLGKVVNYTISTDDFKVEQIIVKRPVYKSLVDPELTISRKEIVEVTDYKIIVKSEEETLKKKAEKEEFVPNFVNPFRGQGAKVSDSSVEVETRSRAS